MILLLLKVYETRRRAYTNVIIIIIRDLWKLIPNENPKTVGEGV